MQAVDQDKLQPLVSSFSVQRTDSTLLTVYCVAVQQIEIRPCVSPSNVMVPGNITERTIRRVRDLSKVAQNLVFA